MIDYTLNTTLNELFSVGDIPSVRSYNVCKYSELWTLEAILKFYCGGHSFLELRNSGPKSQMELANFCKRMLDSGSFIYDEKTDSVLMSNLLIEEKERFTEILQPLFAHFCRKQNISFEQIYNIVVGKATFSEIEVGGLIEKYALWKDLIQVYRNIMDSSSEEVRTLLEPSAERLEEYWDNHPHATFLADYSLLSPIKIDYLSSYYHKCLEQCSARTRNGLAECESVQIFLELCLWGKIRNLANIGAKSVIEIDDLFKLLATRIASLNQEDDDSVYINLLKNKYPYLKGYEDRILDYYIANHSLPLLLLMQAYFQNTEERDVRIFAKAYGILEAPVLREEIGQDLKYSYERIRQIVKKQYEELQSHPVFSENWNQYIELLEGEILLEDSEVIDFLRKSEGLELSGRNILLLLSYVSDYTYLAPLNSRYSISLNYAYLIKTELTELFDFHSFFRLFVERNQNVDRVEDEAVSIRELIICSTSWKSRFSKVKLRSVVAVASTLLMKELQLKERYENILVVPKNAEKSGDDLVYEILKRSGKPMHVAEILKSVIELAPNHRIKEENQLRPILLNNEDFIPLGKTSTYALKEWGMKSGTIKELAFDYISSSSVPVDFDEVADYIQEKHPGKSRESIWVYLCYYATKQFCYFGNNLFGISGKDYGSEYVVTTVYGNWTQKEFSKRFEDLKSFVATYSRFPFSNGVPEEEAALYHFLHRPSVRKMPEVADFIEANKHLIYDKSIWDIIQKLRQIKEHVLTYGSLPDSRTPLYGVWYRCNQAELEDKLDSERQALVIEIRMLLDRKKTYGDLFAFADE